MTKVLLLVVQQQYKVRHEQVQRTELPAGVSQSGDVHGPIVFRWNPYLDLQGLD
jgi:hypothetical protein